MIINEDAEIYETYFSLKKQDIYKKAILWAKSNKKFKLITITQKELNEQFKFFSKVKCIYKNIFFNFFFSLLVLYVKKTLLTLIILLIEFLN